MKEKYIRMWEEAIGKLTEFKVHSEIAIVNLSIRNENIIIKIPLSKLRSNFKNVNERRGKMIGVLRTDKVFTMREINRNAREPNARTLLEDNH